MLVLSRKRGEAVVLPGCDVIVTVIKVSRGRVKLGIAAPTGVKVHRKEILERLSNRHRPPRVGWPAS